MSRESPIPGQRSFSSKSVEAAGQAVAVTVSAPERRIRVLQVVTRLVHRGASRHVIDLARSLDPTRFEVEIAAGYGEAFEGSLWEEAEKTGLRCHRIKHLQREISPVADVRAFLALLKLIRRGDYDVMHTHISKSGFLGRVAARLSHIPVIIHTYHGVLEELAGNGLRPRTLRACERACAAMSDCSIAISQRVAEQFEVAGIVGVEDVVVIHNGIDLERFRPQMSLPRPKELKTGPVIGTVGSLTLEKGTADLIEAAAVLCSSWPDLTICIVGGGPLRETLEARVRQLGIAKQVLFAGVVDNVLPWVSAFDVFVLPSRSEGMPLALVEAMALGCPVVATKVGGVPEVMGDAGVLIQSERADILANELAQLLSDDGRRQRLAQAGREQSKQFSLLGMATRTGELYEQLLA